MLTIIKYIYKAKSCLMSDNMLSEYFMSSTGVRHSDCKMILHNTWTPKCASKTGVGLGMTTHCL